jgi:hypothetical protein
MDAELQGLEELEGESFRDKKMWELKMTHKGSPLSRDKNLGWQSAAMSICQPARFNECFVVHPEGQKAEQTKMSFKKGLN